MMKLSLRLVPGLWSVFPLPPKEFVASTITTFGAGKCEYQGHEIVFTIPTLDELVRTSRDLFEVLNIEGCIVPRSNIAPIQAIAYDEGENISEVWTIAPPGYLMVPGYKNLSQVQPWLYDWSVMSLAWDDASRPYRFPYRSLLLLGQHETECFFCGSHDHTTGHCMNCWKVDEEGFTAAKMAAIPWSHWPEALRKGASSIRGVEKGLNNLREDLRREFKVDYVLKIASTNATTFSELSSYPQITPSEYSQLTEAIKSGSKKNLEKAVHSIKGKVPDQVYHLFQGVVHVMNDNWEEAMASWWEAENLAHKPILKSYASLLQMRIHFLKGNKEGAMASAAKGLKVDKGATPLKYWNMIIAGLWRQQNVVKEYAESFKRKPRWLAASLAEPLLLVHGPMIEQVFDKALSYYEKVTHTLVEDTDSLLDSAEKAFGEGSFEEFRTRFRDWRGQLPNAGYADLLNSREFFDAFKTEIYKEIGRLHKQYLKTMTDCCSSVQKVIQNLPRKKAFLPVLSRSSTFLKQCNSSVRKYKRYDDLSSLRDFTSVKEKLEEESRQLIDMANEAIAREWRKMQLRKYAVGGVTFVLVAWVVFYLIHIAMRFM